MKLVPYAGFDPTENDFTGVELRPLELEPPRLRTRLNVNRAWELRHEGKSWKEIGRILAREDGRSSPYKYDSVYNAANYGARK